MEAKTPISRRQFLSAASELAAAGVLLAPCGALLSACGGSDDEISDIEADPNSYAVAGGILTIQLNLETGLASVGSSIRKKYLGFNSNRSIIITQTAAGTFRAMSTVCPHQGESISAPTGGTATCSGHGAVFSVGDVDFGQRVAGFNSGNQAPFNVNFNSGANSINIS